MLISEFEYDLPENLIAQNPPEKRESSRMLVAERSTGTVTDSEFQSFPEFLSKQDILVVNNTRVIPARLFGNSETGGKVELFLVKETANDIWETLARPAKRLKAAKRISFGEKLTAEVVDKTDEGRVLVKFEYSGEFDEVLEQVGSTPLPPYIKRETSSEHDKQRYQTIYAKEKGAIAAPTAGLHFTPHVLERIKQGGAEIAEITLHVGYGTFEPVRVSDLAEHRVLAERFFIDDQTAVTLNKAKKSGKRIVAVGTTTTRALESSFGKNREFIAGNQIADLTITPGYRFEAIDALLTNFHLPKSSLLVLVSTFGGYDFIMSAYRHAVNEKYRFYSYGDCMFVI